MVSQSLPLHWINEGSCQKDMREANSPMIFWDYCLDRRGQIHNVAAKSNIKLHGSNAHTMTTGGW